MRKKVTGQSGSAAHASSQRAQGRPRGRARCSTNAAQLAAERARQWSVCVVLKDQLSAPWMGDFIIALPIGELPAPARRDDTGLTSHAWRVAPMATVSFIIGVPSAVRHVHRQPYPRLW